MKPFKWIIFANMIAIISLSTEVRADIRTTARYHKKSVDSLAVTFAADAKLASVSCYEMDTTGKSSVWFYVYLSADSLKEYRFLAQNNQVTFDNSEEMRVGIGVLIESWIDSDSALSVAERGGGSDIREMFPFCGIAASIVMPIAPPFYCLWRVDYKLSGIVRTILVNAASGEVVTSIPTGDDRDLPIQYCLQQNFPNPFNPSTTISYSIPRKSFVSLKIFDVVGREIESIVNEDKNPGEYNIRYNASRLSSGIYFLRLEAGNFVNVKRCVIIK
jgi:hypothetical protein